MRFHETVYGKRFYEGQLPRLIKVLERIANALEQQNEPVIEERPVAAVTITKMTREDFLKLFGLKDGSDAMENFDECVDQTGLSWFDIAQMQIQQMDGMIRDN